MILNQDSTRPIAVVPYGEKPEKAGVMPPGK
jgi:hypothetical protein